MKITQVIILSALLAFLIPTSFAAGPVSRAAVTTELDSQARPVSNLSTVDSTVNEVIFYTEIEGMSGETILHRWIHNGNTIATINIQIRSNAARTWSTASIDSSKVGSWEVQVLNSGGQVLMAQNFDVTSPRQQSVQMRVQQQYSNDCLVILEELRAQLEENPESPYLRFKVQQQESRCNR